MTVTDRIHFKMPMDRELQFPAMAALTTYVNDYKARVKANDPSGGQAKFELDYSVDITKNDWDFFKRAGVSLVSEPSWIGAWHSVADMEADMSDERINSFKGRGKHASTVCALMCGVATTSLLNVRKVKPRKSSHRWCTIHGSGFEEIILNFEDEEVTGVIGRAGVETYLAASMGLPVIEVVEDSRPSYWLSKWLNPGYRMVRTCPGDDSQVGLIGRAMASVERTLSK